MKPSMEGGCTCRQVRYRLTGTPLIVHACHCRWCQRETGTAHALNALYEADRVAHIAVEPEIIVTPSASGKGQKIARCTTCKVAVWSNYPQAGSAVRFVRVGTMDDPTLPPTDIHIFTASKQPWVALPAGAKAVPEFCDLEKVWSAASLERRRIMRAKVAGAELTFGWPNSRTLRGGTGDARRHCASLARGRLCRRSTRQRGPSSRPAGSTVPARASKCPETGMNPQQGLFPAPLQVFTLDERPTRAGARPHYDPREEAYP